MPPDPLTKSEVARRLNKDRATVRKRLGELGLEVGRYLTPEQFEALKEDFRMRPTLPWGSLRG